MTDKKIPDFSKSSDGLIPAIIQHYISGKVLMLGYMNAEAFEVTLKEKRVTFFSRSKGRLWVKGEESKNYLNVVSLSIDCDSDAILIQANPQGPTCHSGDESCFHDDSGSYLSILSSLEILLKGRRDQPQEGSYTSKLLSEDLARVAQKVGEEGVEVALASLVARQEEFVGEVADLWFHSLVLLAKKKVEMSEVLAELKKRRH